MDNPPLKNHSDIKFEDNEYLCSDLRDAANYVNSFQVHFTLTTNIDDQLKNELSGAIFYPLFHSAKEVTAFFDSASVINAENFNENWLFHKDRIKAKNPVKCKDDFLKLWFNSKVAFILTKDDFISSKFFDQCNDVGVLLNPRTAYEKHMWNYVRYRIDTYNQIAICTDYHDVSDQSNAPLLRPKISIVAKGANLNSLLSTAFKFCKVTNNFSLENGKICHARIGRIKFNESHLKKQGKDLLEGFGDVIEEKLRNALMRKGLFMSLNCVTTYIQFEYRPETWDDYLSIIREELMKLDIPKSTTIVSNSHPCKKIEYDVYND